MKILRQTRAFTLVELLIAIAIVGIVSVVIFRLFDVTSQNFREVNQLSSINDRLRFANERLRIYLQGAASQSTPDSATDPDVRPTLDGYSTTARVVGLLPYNGWQNDQPAAMAGANPNASYDGIIVVGAYDFLMSFELAGLQPNGGSERQGWIMNHERGVLKIARQDPFTDGLQQAANATGVSLVSGLLNSSNMETRVLRLLDRQGYKQFVRPLTIGAAGASHVTVEVEADDTLFGPKFKQPGQLAGIDDLPEGDVAYDAAFLDAYWIHVEPSPSNPQIMELVRERLCANIVIQSGTTSGFDPTDALPSNCGGDAERVVLASHVADFQVWFDCASAVGPSGGEPDGGLRGLTWAYEWTRDDHSTSDADCMTVGTSFNPGNVRAGHVRLALHTHQERPDQEHVQFEDLQGGICDPADVTSCDATRLEFATLRTFDYVPNTKGSARVVVMQTDFELVNFVNRNQLSIIP